MTINRNTYIRAISLAVVLAFSVTATCYGYTLDNLRPVATANNVPRSAEQNGVSAPFADKAETSIATSRIGKTKEIRKLYEQMRKGKEEDASEREREIAEQAAATFFEIYCKPAAKRIANRVIAKYGLQHAGLDKEELMWRALGGIENVLCKPKLPDTLGIFSLGIHTRATYLVKMAIVEIFQEGFSKVKHIGKLRLFETLPKVKEALFEIADIAVLDDYVAGRKLNKEETEQALRMIEQISNRVGLKKEEAELALMIIFGKRGIVPLKKYPAPKIEQAMLNAHRFIPDLARMCYPFYLSPRARLELSELQEAITSPSERLTARERKILFRYFILEWTLKRIGEDFNVSKGRVGQIIAKGKRKIYWHPTDKIKELLCLLSNRDTPFEIAAEYDPFGKEQPPREIFMGTYYRMIDGKGRLCLPLEFRRLSNAEAGKNFYISIAPDEIGPHMIIFDEPGWFRFRKRYLELMDKKGISQDKWFNTISSKLKKAKLDKQGRLMIPADFYKHLTGKSHAEGQYEVAVVGIGEYMEVWPKSIWGTVESESMAKLKEAIEPGGVLYRPRQIENRRLERGSPLPVTLVVLLASSLAIASLISTGNIILFAVALGIFLLIPVLDSIRKRKRQRERKIKVEMKITNPKQALDILVYKDESPEAKMAALNYISSLDGLVTFGMDLRIVLKLLLKKAKDARLAESAIRITGKLIKDALQWTEESEQAQNMAIRYLRVLFGVRFNQKRVIPNLQPNRRKIIARLAQDIWKQLEALSIGKNIDFNIEKEFYLIDIGHLPTIRRYVRYSWKKILLSRKITPKVINRLENEIFWDILNLKYKSEISHDWRDILDEVDSLRRFLEWSDSCPEEITEWFYYVSREIESIKDAKQRKNVILTYLDNFLLLFALKKAQGRLARCRIRFNYFLNRSHYGKKIISAVKFVRTHLGFIALFIPAFILTEIFTHYLSFFDYETPQAEYNIEGPLRQIDRPLKTSEKKRQSPARPDTFISRAIEASLMRGDDKNSAALTLKGVVVDMEKLYKQKDKIGMIKRAA